MWAETQLIQSPVGHVQPWMQPALQSRYCGLSWNPCRFSISHKWTFDYEFSEFSGLFPTPTDILLRQETPVPAQTSRLTKSEPQFSPRTCHHMGCSETRVFEQKSSFKWVGRAFRNLTCSYIEGSTWTSINDHTSAPRPIAMPKTLAIWATWDVTSAQFRY